MRSKFSVLYRRRSSRLFMFSRKVTSSSCRDSAKEVVPSFSWDITQYSEKRFFSIFASHWSSSDQIFARDLSRAKASSTWACLGSLPGFATVVFLKMPWELDHKIIATLYSSYYVLFEPLVTSADECTHCCKAYTLALQCVGREAIVEQMKHSCQLYYGISLKTPWLRFCTSSFYVSSIQRSIHASLPADPPYSAGRCILCPESGPGGTDAIFLPPLCSPAGSVIWPIFKERIVLCHSKCHSAVL